MNEFFKYAKAGDIIICTYIAGNQKNLTLSKEYIVLKSRGYDNFASVLIQTDSGKKVWFNNHNTSSYFEKQTEMNITPKSQVEKPWPKAQPEQLSQSEKVYLKFECYKLFTESRVAPSSNEIIVGGDKLYENIMKAQDNQIDPE